LEVDAGTTEAPVLPRRPPARLSRFVDTEAEVGSDNEGHDDAIRVGSHSDEDGLVDQDQDLAELIDNSTVD
jgi:hypothetical protein